MKQLHSVLILSLFLLFSFQLRSQAVLGDNIDKVDYNDPKLYEIGGIVISGVQYLDKNALIILSGLSIGDKINIPGDEITKAIKNLWSQGLFENVRISSTGIQSNLIFLEIYLEERPRLHRYSFSGIKKGEADKIREEIKLTTGDIVTDNTLIRTQTKIKKYFGDKGYHDVVVDIKIQRDTIKTNHVNLQIDITRNNKVRIKEIRFTGNQHFADDKLKRFLKETKEKGSIKPLNNIENFVFNLSKNLLTLNYRGSIETVRKYSVDNFRFRIFKASKFIQESYTEDKLNLIKKYNESGYRDAIITSDSIIRNADGTMSIVVNLVEGNKYRFGNVSWVGNTKYSSAELNEFLRIKKGDIYNMEVLNSNLNFNMNEDDISSRYMNDGYLFFSVEPVEISVANDSIDLEIRINEGRQATINRVTIKGNTRTNDHVVFRDIRTRPGQLFSRSDIIRTTRELAQLRYFDPEKINPVVNPNPSEGTVDIEYEVEETSSDQVELSGGWGYGRVVGTLGVSFNNFSARNIFDKSSWRPVPTGGGQKLSVRVQSYGKGYIGYNLSFTEPWLGGKKPNSFSISYYHSLYSNGLPRSDEDRQSFVINGLSFGLGKRLEWPDDYFQVYHSIDLQRYDLNNYSKIFSFGTGNGFYNNFGYNFVLTRHSVDAPIFSRTGSIVSLSVELTPPYSAFSDKDYSTLEENEKYKWIEYHKWKFNANYFTQIVGNLVLMSRAKYGFLGYYNPEIGVTPFERFYLGGDGLSGYNNLDGREIIGMRGYSNESLTPDYYLSKNTGGTIYNKYTMELRYPLSLNPNSTIYTLAFLEGGNAWNSFDKFNPFNLKRSVGLGVRIFLPMFGMLGLDWGYGLDEIPGLPDANKGQFHFSINQSID